MADLLRDAAAWLTDQLRGSAGSTVAYVRGDSTATMTATVGRSIFQSETTGGVIEQHESRDFIVKADELPYGEPLRGDKIYETLDGIAQIYEVRTPRGVPLFHYADAFQTSVRVHTVRIDEDATYLVNEQGDEIVVPLELS